MYKGKKIIAIIPARGGSKGIPGKNLIDLNGRSLLSYTVEAAVLSGLIDAVVVSTDSKEIQKEAIRWGAQVPFLRSEAIAGDHSKTIECVQEVLGKWNASFDILVLLQPTSPLRTKEDIVEALERFFEGGEKGLVSVSPSEESPLLLRTIENEQVSPILDVKNSTVRRQDMKAYYRVNGAIYINLVEEINDATSFNDNPHYYLMMKSHSVDIDEYVDLAIAQYYLLNPESL